MNTVRQVRPPRWIRGPRDPENLKAAALAAAMALPEPCVEPGDKTLYVVGATTTHLSVRTPITPGLPGTESRPADEASADRRLPVRSGMRVGPFVLIRRLGQGAQGDVWKARRVDPPGGLVALKVLNPVLARHPSRLAQFRREAERGARLAGPSLLQIIESGQVEGLPYMAMPFVEGITLLELIRGRQAHLKSGPVEPIHRLMTADEKTYQRAIVCILSRAASALGQLHAGGVVHRDIKPANILIDAHRGGRVFLCDLGLGRDLEVATIEQMRDGAGTPMYMAPERLLRAPADEILCDLYSLGVTLYEALTLDRPFAVPAGLPLSCLSGYLASARPRRPRRLNPEIPASLETLILRAMARNPADRPQSALELAAELDKFPAQGAVPAPHAASGRARLAATRPHRVRPSHDAHW